MKLIRSTLVTTQVTSENIKYQVTTKGTQERKYLVNTQGTPGSKDQVPTKWTLESKDQVTTQGTPGSKDQATTKGSRPLGRRIFIAHRIIRLEKVITICVS